MPESRLLPVSGTIRMPPGITMADVTVTYLGVLRGGGLVSGGTLKALAGADGVPKVNGAALQLQVAFAGDFVERHPYARFGVSYRGAARGYEFDVDLALPPEATAVDIAQTVGGLAVMTAAQNAGVQEVLGALPEARRLPGIISDAEKAAADARALLEAQRGTLVYHLPGAAPAGMERFYTLDPNNFKPARRKVVVMGVEREIEVIEAGF